MRKSKKFASCRFRPAVEALEARDVPAMFTWIGNHMGIHNGIDYNHNWIGDGTTSNWQVSGVWQANGPTSSDSVTFDNNAVTYCDTGFASVNTVRQLIIKGGASAFANTLNINYGLKILPSDSNAGTIDTSNLNDITIGGGDFLWVAGGTLTYNDTPIDKRSGADPAYIYIDTDTASNPNEAPAVMNVNSIDSNSHWKASVVVGQHTVGSTTSGADGVLNFTNTMTVNLPVGGDANTMDVYKNDGVISSINFNWHGTTDYAAGGIAAYPNSAPITVTVHKGATMERNSSLVNVGVLLKAYVVNEGVVKVDTDGQFKFDGGVSEVNSASYLQLESCKPTLPAAKGIETCTLAEAEHP